MPLQDAAYSTCSTCCYNPPANPSSTQPSSRQVLSLAVHVVYICYVTNPLGILVASMHQQVHYRSASDDLLLVFGGRSSSSQLLAVFCFEQSHIAKQSAPQLSIGGLLPLTSHECWLHIASQSPSREVPSTPPPTLAESNEQMCAW